MRIKKPTERRNHAIRAPKLRVIDEAGNQVGVLSKEEAIRAAKEKELDLVEISPNANPPVAKIVEWGKYSYQKTKKLQKARQKAKASDLKQMRFGLKIGQHDLEVKTNKIASMLEQGHKVKVMVFFRGREMAHKDLGFDLARRVIEYFGDSISVDQQPQLSGKQLTFVIRSTNAKAKNP
jgi:translation initiation factor IF-3